jgi:mRNA interferase HicA
VKRVDLIRRLQEAACVLVRHGGKHDWYTNPQTKMSQPVPRHREINETLAKHILKKLQGPKSQDP